VVPFCIKAVEVGLDAWGQERSRKDEAKDYCLCLAWPDPGPACECGIVTFAFAQAPLKTTDRATFDFTPRAMRNAWLDAA
jgi:hypothetical protein